ncbi:MAG: hypothetical protein IJW54_00595 [Clostridia bacterium]|nr:hypothetical protein [Clostridia bacterium]
MKKFKIVALLLTLCLGLVMLIGCGGSGDQPCTEHVDSDTNGECDNCGESVCVEHTDVNKDDICDVCRKEIEKVNITFEITLKDEKGEAVPNIEITLNQYGEVKGTYTTDATGKIIGEVSEAGKYTVIFTELPLNWYSSNNYSEITINQTSNTFDFVAVDNTPNGSTEKPFPSENAETGEAAKVVFPAGQTYNFITKGASRYIVINNANAKLIYKDKEYLPDENGVVRVLFDATEATSVTMFQVVNTANEENEIGLSFEVIKGTSQNPYDAVAGEEYTVSVAPEQNVHYSFVSDKDGVLMVKSPSAKNDITLYNTTSYVVANATNGNGVSYIPVRVGDVVSITVGVISNSEEESEEEAVATEIKFELTVFAGTEAEPIAIYENSIIRVGKGVTYYFSLEEGALVTITSDVAISVNNGDASMTTTGVEGTFTVSNSTDENAEISITINE